MSYGIDLAFKHTPRSEVFTFIEKFKAAVMKDENAEKILQDNQYFSPIQRYDYMTDKAYFIDRLTESWLGGSVFTFKFVYVDEIETLIAILNSDQPDDVAELFDGFIYFQNSCDQNYDYTAWDINPTFKAIKDKIQPMTAAEFLAEQTEYKAEDIDQSQAVNYDALEYCKQSYIYTKCYGIIEPFIWGENQKIIGVLVATGWNELYDLKCRHMRHIQEYREKLKAGRAAKVGDK